MEHDFNDIFRNALLNLSFPSDVSNDWRVIHFICIHYTILKSVAPKIYLDYYQTFHTVCVTLVESAKLALYSQVSIIGKSISCALDTVNLPSKPYGRTQGCT